MGVQIVYTSRTGNTEKLAEAVFAAVPVKEKNVKRIEERTERKATGRGLKEGLLSAG